MSVAASGVTAFDSIERQWIARALQLLRASLFRARQKEVGGSEIYGMRTKELQQLDVLIGKVS